MDTEVKNSPYCEGDPSSKICVIAQAPARNEMLQGRPLVGQAGQVFDELLHRAGLIRRECYIVNVLKTPISDEKEYLNNKGLTTKGREAARDLGHRIKDCEANVFVPMGNLALCCLTNQLGITRQRGSVMESTLLTGRKVIPTIHPAATLPGRGPYVQRYTIINDLKKAKRHSRYPELRLPQRDLRIWPKMHEVVSFLEVCRDSHAYAFDIETINWQISCISFAPTPGVSLSIPFYGNYWSETEEAMVWLEIAKTLGDPRAKKVGQGVMFDISYLWMKNKIRIRGEIADTMIRHRILYPDFPAKLEFLCSTLTDEPFYKDDRKLWSRPDADPDRFARYNARDSAVTIECENVLAPEIEADDSYAWTYRTTMSLFEPCLYMMTRGIQLNEDRLNVVRAEVKQELEEKESELKEVAEVDFNPVGLQAQKYFYIIKGIKPYINRKTGKPTLDDTALARIIRRYNLPEARLVQEIRALRKIRDTYLEFEYDKDARVRCMYDPRGTYTGRLSSKKTAFGTGLNMQNLHPRFKYFLIPG